MLLYGNFGLNYKKIYYFVLLALEEKNQEFILYPLFEFVLFMRSIFNFKFK